MATGRDGSNYNATSLIRKDFRDDHGSGPEEISRSSKRKASKWCKGKEGREHEFEWAVWWSYWYGPPEDRRESKSGGQTCKRCGKRDYMSRYKPKKKVEKHKHIYDKTEVHEDLPGYKTMYESCSICGRLGDYIYLRD